ASQFSRTTGEVQTSERHYQTCAFARDSWRVIPNFTVSAGLRYARHNDVSRRDDITSRDAFAGGVGSDTTAPPTVIRGHIVICYERIRDRVLLRTRQLDGVRQTQHFVSDTSSLDLFPEIPPPNVLSGFVAPQSTVRLASDLRAPYTVNSSLAVERRLFKRFTVALTASRLRTTHLLLSRTVD